MTYFLLYAVFAFKWIKYIDPGRGAPGEQLHPQLSPAKQDSIKNA